MSADQHPADVINEEERANETCPADHGDHDWRVVEERYGEDADGNRGLWLYFERCAKCGEER